MRFELFVNTLSLLIPVSVAYAVVRHRVLDIRVFVRSSVRYLLARRALQLLTAVPAAAILYAGVINRDRTIRELITQNTGYFFWIIAAVLSLRFRGPIQSWLDRKFFREELGREQMLLGLVDDLGKIDSIPELSELVAAKLENALHPSHSYLWYRDPGDCALATSSSPAIRPPDFPSDGAWLSWLEAQGTVSELPLPADARLAQNEAEWFSSHGIALAIPIPDSSDRLAAVLLLGAKKSEERYTATDRRLLQTIAKQVAVVRENVRLRAQVSREQQIKHDVLARLDGRMRDLLKECPACGACFDAGVERCAHDDEILVLSLPVGRTIDGRYRLDRLIGKGGMGAVYEAHDLQLDRSVAVKIMLGRAFGQQTAIRRFRREARVTASLNHPNVVRVYDFGLLEGDGAYFVMERVRGVTLRVEMDQRRALPPRAAAEWFDPLLDGVAAAHAHGVIHRDLKPENVVGERTANGSLSVKVLDLGLAKVRDQEQHAAVSAITVEGAVMGTFGYMSPEQLLGRDVDHRTDIFAIGVMLAESLTGRRPWRGRFEGDFTDAIGTSFQLPGTSPQARAVSHLLGQCLAFDLRVRWSSAGSLRDELIPLLRQCPRLDVAG